MITPAFPPYEGSHTQRMIAMANSFVENGFNVYVLTLEILEGSPSFSTNSALVVDPRVKIFRSTAGKIHKKIYGKSNNIQNSSDHQQTSKNRKNKRGIIHFLNNIKKNIFIPIQ